VSWSGPTVVVVSAHLDDAVLSLGATVAELVRGGARVKVVTVFAGNPESNLPVGGWDGLGGFRTEGEASTARRREDEEACGIVGAVPVWLPFSEADYREGMDEAGIVAALAPELAAADAALAPGFPLMNPDHAVVARLVLGNPPPGRLGLYAEQPYRYWVRATQPKLTLPDSVVVANGWTRRRAQPALLRTKRRAIRAYTSQLRLLGLIGRRNLRLDRMLLHELAKGGEAIAWLPEAPTQPRSTS
jgi:LmbE family N-acetylglucosaminyl deacetylase